MNLLRTGCAFFAVAFLIAAAPCHAGTPAGLGGFQWNTAAPQSNALHGVAAPIPGSGGVGFVAAGDACTFLYRRSPIGVGASGWVGGRGRSIDTHIQYRGVAALRAPSRIAVAVSDGSVLIGDGSVFATAPLSVQALNAVAWTGAAGARRLSIVGDSGAAFTYDDATGKFTPSVIDGSLESTADLFSLSFPDQGLVGYAAGDVPGTYGPQGALFRTDDGGGTWMRLSATPAADAWLDVSFVTPSAGFALGSLNGTGIVAATPNGGTSWETVAIVDGTMRAIGAFDMSRVVLVGGNGIFTATDGAKFNPRPEPVSGLVTPVPLEDVDISKSEAWAVGEGGVIFASYDRGDTWSVFGDIPTLDRSSLEDVNAMRYTSDTRVLAAGANGSILRSDDGGGTFSASPRASADKLFALALPGARNAGTTAASDAPVVAVGARRTLAILDTAKATASLQGNVPLVDYFSVTAFPIGASANVWAVGQGGTIVASQNDSPVWNRQPSPVTQDLRAVQAVAAGTGYHVLACGLGGTILRSLNGTDWGPVDPGGSLTPLPSPFTTADLNGIAFRTPLAGVVVGEGGIIGRTGDGGQTWTVQRPVQGASLRAVSVLPSSFSLPELWAVGDHQTVLRSVTAGQDWEVLSPPVIGTPGSPVPDIAFRAVQAVAPGVAFIAGDEGHLLQTLDGGGSWTEWGATTADTYFALRMPGQTYGIAAVSNLFSGPTVSLTLEEWRSSIPAALPRAPGGIFGVEFLNGQAIAVGAGGYIARTFEPVSPEPPDFHSESGDLRGIVSPQAGQYVAVGDGGLLMRSTDSGATWRRALFASPFGPDCQLRAVAFAVPDTTGNAVGYAAGGVPGGGVPVLLRTTDSGETWRAIDVGMGASGASINALAAFSNRVLAAAENGAVYAYDGLGWSIQRPVPGFNGAWNALSATDGRWYVAGDAGMAARFPDSTGKQEWVALNTGTAWNLHTLAAPPYPTGSGFVGFGGGIESLRDDIRGAGGNWGVILATASGGEAMWGSTTLNPPVSPADVVEVLKVWAGLTMPTLPVYYFGDVWPPAPDPESLPGDGILDLNDAAQILRMVYGL